MSPLVIALALLLLGVLIVAVRAATPGLGRAVEKASDADDPTPVVEAIERLKPSGRSAAFNHAIRQLWDRYERPLAVALVKVLAERHTDSLIAQYWLKQVMLVEPDLAREHLSKEFMDGHYKPEVAARCGPVG